MDYINNKKKTIIVAQIIGKITRGGVESVINNYYFNINHSHINFDFFVEKNSPYPPLDELIKQGATIYYISSPKHPIKHIKELLHYFKKNRYDVVHVNLNTLSIFALFAAKVANIPIRINHSHSTTSRQEPIRNMMKRILSLFSHFFCTDMFACSKEAGEFQFGKKAILNNKVTIVPNGIDISKFAYSSTKRKFIRDKYKISENTIVFGTIGRCEKQKNQLFLIKLFALFHKKNPHSMLLIIGYGSLLEKLKRLVKRINISDNVLFLGAIDNPENYYSCMDVFILPSLYEGFGVSLLEAECNGLPSLVSNALPNSICLNYTKKLSLKEKPEKWINAMFNLSKIERYKGDVLIKELGFDIKENAKKYEEIIEKKVTTQL